MPKLKEVRERILLFHANHLISDEECILLYDLNKSTNLCLPYWNFERFELQNMNDDECWSEFRLFHSGEISRLIEILNLPQEIVCYNKVTCGIEEAFCIFLKRFAYPCRYQDLIHRFARPVPQLCMISNVVMNHIYNN